MSEKPVVGINLCCECDPFGAGSSDLLLPRWLECIGQAGAIPIVVPPLHDETDVLRVLTGLQAFVFAGCQDLGPGYCEDGPEMSETNADVLLLRSIAERRLPFLGIGTGMQLLTTALGGTLCSLRDAEGSLARHIYPHNPRHGLRIRRGSLLDRVCHDRPALVGSMHAVAVDQVPVGFAVTARSPDGAVEAIESDSGQWLAAGIQFLPQPAGSGLDLRLFDRFVRSVLSREARRGVPAAERGW
jgi:gamma-glutamyl-gamma-aminobutyrate hydrolase PuuD